jgi:multicomponent Na+:H+ antiporter subunit B
LLAIFFSALVPICTGAPVLTGLWLDLSLPLLGHVHLGTPMLFDVGVYSAVIGVNLVVVFTLSEA